MKKISLIVIITLMLSISFAPQKARAFVVFESGANLFSNIGTQISNVWQASKDTVLIPLAKQIAFQVTDKLVQDTLVWANGGFNGDPGFITDFDSFLTETKFDSLSGNFKEAEKKYKELRNQQQCVADGNAQDCDADFPFEKNYQECITGLDINNPDDEELIELCEEAYENEEFLYDQCVNDLNICSADPGAIAAQNYQTLSTGEVKRGRNVLGAIVEQGTNQLNADDVKAIVEGNNESLTKLLGSQQEVDRFKNDFGKGGWSAQLALLDANNLPSGVKSITKSVVGKESLDKVSRTIQDFQTPQRFFNKTRCIEPDPENPDGCLREVTETPGAIVGNSVMSSLQSEQRQANSSDSLVGILVQSLGTLTSGLIDGGISSLTNAATGALFDAAFGGGGSGGNGGTVNPFTETVGSTTGFDVLGVIDGNVTSSTNNTVTSPNGTPVDIGSGGFIGGPEDTGDFGTSPQIIIDLKANLEKGVEMVEEEQGYFDEINTARRDNQNQLIQLDQCLPGPDYNWEERYGDVFQTTSNDDTSQQNRLWLSETRDMTNDTRINIPGSGDLRNSFDILVSDSQQDKFQDIQRTRELTTIASTLNLVRQEVERDFNQYKASTNANLVLFYEDWNRLSQSQQRSAFEYASNEGYYLLKQSESFDSVLSSNNERAAQAVIDLSWDVWREETPSERKNELRYSYYSVSQNLAEQFVSNAKNKRDVILLESRRAGELAQDCYVLKLYILGAPESEILQGIQNGSISENSRFNPSTSKNSEGIRFINTSNSRSDNEVKSFLEREYNSIQNSNSSAFFSSTTLINPTAISQSILGFDSEDDKEEYFDRFYPDDGMPKEYLKNAQSLKDIFKLDRINYNNRYLSGLLFCRNERYIRFGAFQGEVTECVYPWYKADTFDYEVAFAGI